MILGVIGLGYVGLPLAVLFSRKMTVIGFDINKNRIEAYKNGMDLTGEAGNEAVRNADIKFTYDEDDLDNVDIYIIAVPTPVNEDYTPDISLLIEASRIVGKHMKAGNIIVYESTVYPGATEDICIPVLEKYSGFLCGKDFKVGYSPERINPGDSEHRLQNMKKIVSGCDEEAVEKVTQLYRQVIDAEICNTNSIKVAEAAKLAENVQRDINIAFMNELSMMLDKMGIHTQEVIDAMNTKWNALGFYPGLVGGHCIGVDPYYLLYKAQSAGYDSQMIRVGRRINEGMADYIAGKVIKQLILAGKCVRESRIAVLGITYKEDCSDIRNSKAIELVHRLKEYGMTIHIIDDLAYPDDVLTQYGMELERIENVNQLDGIVLVVPHMKYKNIPLEQYEKMFCESVERVFIDVKGVMDRVQMENHGFFYWSL